MGALALRGIRKLFGATAALDGVDLDVAPGEILGVTGPSGAGKSTLCRIVAGVEAPTEGDVVLDGRTVTGVPPERRRVAFMFESYALYPHLTVFDNVAFPLRAPGAPRRAAADIAARVREILRFVELDALERRRPGELSGGQKQRVALGRALVQEPRARLLDEPISHLDAKLRHVLRGELRRRLRATETPTIWTSPDAGEALAVADRVAVLVRGRLAQVGRPAEIFRRPASVDVARLVGDPPMNLLGGTLEDAGGTPTFRHAAFSLPLAHAAPPSEKVIVGLRPSEVTITHAGPVRGEVWIWEPLGKHGILTVRVGSDLVKVKTPRAGAWAPGQTVGLDLGTVQAVVFDAATGAAC
jgi:ABC-type sugar transport system ATPase subunit